MPRSDRPARRDGARLQRLQRELGAALAQVPPGELAAWGGRAAALFGQAGVRRTRELWQLGGALLRWSRDEAGALGREARAGRGVQHLGERLRHFGRQGGAGLGRLQLWGCDLVRGLREEPRAVAPRLASVVLSHLLGREGGTAETALAGVDAARNLAAPGGFAGDILGGALLEAGVLAMVDLSRLLAPRLPAQRDPLWDQLVRGSDWVTQLTRASAAATPPDRTGGGTPPPPPATALPAPDTPLPGAPPPADAAAATVDVVAAPPAPPASARGFLRRLGRRFPRS